MSAPSISKIHVTNSTGLSLNERFTAIYTKPANHVNRARSRSRSRSIIREVSDVDPALSMANRRLLNQLDRTHKLRAALKLKRRSMRTMGASLTGGRGRGRGQGGATPLKRGSIKALRVAPNGRPIRANSMARLATMNADFITRRGRPLRRSDNVSSRLDMTRRPLVGGAAERVARRRLERLAGDGGRKPRGRSRSRSRSRQAGVGLGAHSRSRSRSRSRPRGREQAGARANVPIKARLGLRPGNAPPRPGNAGQRRRDSSRRRNTSISRRGVADGRVDKRARINGTGGANIRPRGRSALRKANGVNGRSRSRSRRGSVGQKQQQPQRQQQTQRQQQQQQQRQRQQQRVQQRRRRSGSVSDRKRRPARGRSQQRNGKAVRKSGNNLNGSKQPVQRRGRSRSRGTRGGRNLASSKTAKSEVKKEDLDKELDQYMATTKTDELDYLLKR